MVSFTLRPLYSRVNTNRYAFGSWMCGPQIRSGRGSGKRNPWPCWESNTVVSTGMFSEWTVNSLCRIRLNSWMIAEAVSWWTNYITSWLSLCSSEFHQDTGCRCLLVGLSGAQVAAETQLDACLSVSPAVGENLAVILPLGRSRVRMSDGRPRGSLQF